MRVSARVRANRANAKRSTGPKTKDGKLRSALNAYKHGLTIPAVMLPEYEPVVHEYAAQLVGGDASSELRVAAMAFAEAQVDIDRVRRIRHALYSDEKAREKQSTRREISRSLFAQLRYLDHFLKLFEKSGQDTLPGVDPNEVVAGYEALSCKPKPLSLEAGMGVLAPQILKLWRYEKRAISRRDKASEDFQFLCSDADTKAG